MEKIEEKSNKLENIMINIEIQQNTLISIGKDPKYVRGIIGKMVEEIIFRKYLERTIKKDDIEKGSLDEKSFEPRFSDPARGIDPGRGEGQRVRGSTGSNRGSTGGIDPVYI